KTSLLEKVGDEPDEITLDVKLVRDLGVNPEEEIELIRGYIKDGTAESLIIGSEVLGEFVITELSEGRSFVDSFGRTQVAELNLTFEEAGAAEQTETATSTDLPLIWL
ncbi:MAG: phage tail protein, partial [Selenomonadaceae bacterium]|nr:phage tail protein [Selenomonadaceae bacterium]